ncbi:sodium ion-translocating decarboxylase subunit beta [Hominifimenecus microfluidus]|uniref:sodium ion-translocating decarboxylase subunit beta n=1 Tax=Hominifimenecus microfluidus TaxID=2885348 RepID=UPI0032C136DD
MILVACVFLFLAIAKGFEPLLLVPIAFGMLLVNIYPTIMDNPTTTYTNAEGNTVATVDYEGEGLDLLCAMNANEIVPVSDNETQLVDASGVVVATITSAEGYTAGDLAYLLASGSYTMTSNAGGLLHYFYILDEWSILPSLIFMGVGAMTDFAPLIANPVSFLMGAAAQLGIYVAYFLAMACGFNGMAAAAISIIGGADGPTSIFLASKLHQNELLGPIAVAAYSYMALVPLIQPPIMKAFTSDKEKKIKMGQLRPVSKLERILFPIVITIVVCMILPSTAPLVGMLMLGNLFRESGVVRQLQETASNALMYIVVILLGTSVGATTSAEAFLKTDTLIIVVCGLVAFMFGTFGGVMLGKLLCKLTGGKINPLIGSAGVSAVPMAARVSQKVGSEYDPTNFLLMHAMGPNVAGVIGTAVAAGTFMAIFGV